MNNDEFKNENHDDDLKEEKQEEKQEEKKEENKEESFRKIINDDYDDEFEKWILNQNRKRRKKGYIFNYFPMLLMIIILSYYIFNKATNSDYYAKPISYSQLITKIDSNNINKIKEKDDYLYADSKYKGENAQYVVKKITPRLGDDKLLMEKVINNGIQIESVEGSNKGFILSIFLNFLPIIILIGFYLYMNHKMTKGDGNGGPGGIFNIGNISAKISEIPNVRFKDVAGVDEAKEELKEVVDFLKTPEKFIKAGARIPKGILLEGDPGTGKTLLAKAVAGESGSSFYTMSGSEFVEMYVGVGASRVRKLFKEAKKNKPAIVFIDEIDAVGRKRGSDRGGNDEREQTLNQLLVEMDGFSDNENIIVIAATNRSDVLDTALTRSGRFDRKIRVNLPDLQSRIEILNVHALNKKFTPEVKLEDIARITPGFSGADLENILNEAAILAARESKTEISMVHLDEAVDKLGMGIGKKNKKVSEYDRKLTAYHEGGHALVATLLKHADKVHKVTIIPRGGAGGYMMPLPDDKSYTSRNKLISFIKVAFGGRIAEQLVMDDISAGAYSDIRSATYTANALIRSYGMNDLIGPVNLEYTEQNIISQQTDREVDMEVRKLLKTLYQETVDLINDNMDKLKNIAELLLEKETITGSEVRALSSGVSLEELKNMSQEEIEKYY